MTRAEATCAVWGMVTTFLAGHLISSARSLERETEEDSARMRAAAESVRRIAERLSKPKVFRRPSS